jgi:hypothetical protein
VTGVPDLGIGLFLGSTPFQPWNLKCGTGEKAVALSDNWKPIKKMNAAQLFS